MTERDAIDEFEARFAWRKDRWIHNLRELAESAQWGGADAMEALAGLGGILQGLTQQVFPLLGAQSLLLIFAERILNLYNQGVDFLAGAIFAGAQATISLPQR